MAIKLNASAIKDEMPNGVGVGNGYLFSAAFKVLIQSGLRFLRDSHSMLRLTANVRLENFRLK